MNPGTGKLQRLAGRVAILLREEFGQLRPRQHAYSMISRAIPLDVGAELRAALLRSRGIEVGEGTLVYGTPELSGGEGRTFHKLTIGRHCRIGVDCAFEVGDLIAIGDRVVIDHQVMIITTTHELGPREHRAGPLVRHPVRIEAGAWIGARSMILPGVTVGAGAIVDPGSAVNRDVAPHTRVRGTPARQVEELAH